MTDAQIEALRRFAAVVEEQLAVLRGVLAGAEASRGEEERTA